MVFPISLPSLRDRAEDISLLAQHFLQVCLVKLKRDHVIVDDQALPRLARYDWPRNIRELQNVIERATILAQAQLFTIDERSVMPSQRQIMVTEPCATLDDSERLHILCALKQAGWRIYGLLGAANRMRGNPSALRSRMKKLRLFRPTSLATLEHLSPLEFSTIAESSEVVKKLREIVRRRRSAPLTSDRGALSCLRWRRVERDLLLTRQGKYS